MRMESMNGFINKIQDTWYKIKNKITNNKIKKMAKEIVDVYDDDRGGKVNEIPHSKPLYAGQFTNIVNDPELLKATNLKAVFEHFKPEVEVDFEDEEGVTVNENLKFGEIGDFEVKNGNGKLVTNSPFLSELKSNIEANGKMSKLISQNSRIKNMLSNSQSKEDLRNVLQYLLNELENVK